MHHDLDWEETAGNGQVVQQLKRDKVQFFAQTLHRREPTGQD